MENGDLLVCNHALFFADLALRGQGVRFLPPYDHVVLDEAHAVEDVASQHFGVALSEARVGHLLNLLYQPRTHRGFLSTMASGSSHRLIDQTIEQITVCRDAAETLFGSLVEWNERHAPENGRVRSAGIVGDPLSGPMRQLAAALKLLREQDLSDADSYELNSYAIRAAQIADDLESLLDQRLEESVYWLELRQSRGAQRRRRRPSVALNCRPIEVGPILAEQLFDREISVILTSATLATGPGQFDHVTQRLGCPGATTLQLGSPFDHAAQMKVLIDSSMPPPHHPDYAEALVPRLLDQIKATGGGAFVLFTSFALLNRIADTLRPLLEDEAYPVLVQERDGPRGLLLRRFRSDERSVLLGTASFWQGVDVRGRALRNVIITRLPFDVPGQPLMEARHERIKARGGEPFTEDQVPRAVIRFKQGVGRLIRSASDSGRVVVLDTRIVTKWYGRKFLEALPEGVEVRDLAEE
jgi:ATP-dependent DNA helicase DinG